MMYPPMQLVKTGVGLFLLLPNSDASLAANPKHGARQLKSKEKTQQLPPLPSLPSPKDFEVTRSLLEINYPAFGSFNGTMHAGLMPASPIYTEYTDVDAPQEDYSSYFFWLFQPDKDSFDSDERTAESFRDDTLIIWLNGGPGCSSMVGLMAENGPVTIPKFGPGIAAPNPSSGMDAPLVANPYAWTRKSAMLFVEQPGGTGFSTASSAWTGEEAETRTEDDVADAFYEFLQNLYRVFGEDLRKKGLYISGESYAGMYIPSIARGIHHGNKRVIASEESNSTSSSSIINLKGLAIGNGWIDVYIQGPTTIDYAFWHGMIDLRTYRSLRAKWDQCVARDVNDDSEPPFHPFTTPDECGVVSAVMAASGSTWTYDVTTYDAYPAVMKIGGSISKFFNDAHVREALNVPSLEEKPQWLACVPGSGRRKLTKHQISVRELILLADDKPLSVVPYIAELLDDAKIDVLLYNGDLDLACSSQSTEMALESMDWSGKQEWMDPDVTPWMEWHVDDQPSGHTKKFNNLEFVVVYNSGHFVPINQARNSLNLIGRLLDGEPFGDKELPQFAKQTDSKKLNSFDPMNEIEDIKEDLSKSNYISSIVVGAVAFVLGVAVSYLYFGHAASRKTFHSSVSSSPFPTTETTPLKHGGA